MALLALPLEGIYDNFSSKEAPDIYLLNYKMTTMLISLFCLVIFVAELPFC